MFYLTRSFQRQSLLKLASISVKSFVSIERSSANNAGIGLAMLYRLLVFHAVTLSSLSNILIAKTSTYNIVFPKLAMSHILYLGSRISDPKYIL
jgi:hypothetical protein